MQRKPKTTQKKILESKITQKEIYASASSNTIVENLCRNVDSNNELGKQMSKKYSEPFFAAITASRKNEEALTNCWVPPDFTISNDVLDLVTRKIPVKPLVEVDTNDKDEILDNIISEFIDRAKKVSSENTNMFIFGNRGSGKTTTMNAVMTLRKEQLRENNIFWLRLSMAHKIPINNDEQYFINLIKKKFRNILFDSENEYFNEFANKGLLTSKKIEHPELSGCPDNSIDFWGKLKNLFDNDIDLFYEIITKAMYEEGYRFIIIYDNIDVIEEESKDIFFDKWKDDRVKIVLLLALEKRKLIIPSFNIILARGTTINKYIPMFNDMRTLINTDNLRAIGRVNSAEVLLKRCEWVKLKEGRDEEKIVVDHNGSHYVFPSWEILVSIFNKYILTNLCNEENIQSEKYFVSELSEENIHDVFVMAMELLSSHLINFQDIVTASLFDLDFELKDHQILWALMLPRNRKYYRNSPQYTFIYNIYDNYNNDAEYCENSLIDSSLLLKRLILEYFKYEKDELFFSKQEIFLLFGNTYGYDKYDIEFSLRDLTYNGILYKFEPGSKTTHYAITKKGKFFRDYVTNQYIYHELALEDTPCPLRLRDKFRLFDYPPGEGNRKYFINKVPMVRHFIAYLAEQERIELKRIKAEGWFSTPLTLVPSLKKSLIIQESKIAKVLKVSLEDIEDKW